MPVRIALIFLLSLLCDGQEQPPTVTTSAPALISKVEPQYSEEARKQKISGKVTLALIVGADGVPKNITIVKGLGFGLDENAVEAVSEWRFTPGMKNGKAVDVRAMVDVTFNLLVGDPNNTVPTIIKKVEPEYSVAGRSAGISGRILLSVVVDQNGVPQDIKIVSPLGYGLDEKAVEAVKKWRFKPALKNGAPIAMVASVEVSFRLGNSSMPISENARTTFNIAVHQLRGDAGFTKDEKTAFQTMQKAAAQGYPPAEVRMGQFYNAGVGTEVDHAKAFEWFDRAAYQGDAEAEYQLGAAYLNGIGTPRDTKLAKDLFARAAQQDQMEAEFALGILSETGEADTPKDLPQAFKWYRKAAEQGQPHAQYHLAKLYWSGEGGKQDQVAALTWALLAQTVGLSDAAPDVKQYRAALTPDKIAEAEKAAGKFKVRAPSPKPVKK